MLILFVMTNLEKSKDLLNILFSFCAETRSKDANGKDRYGAIDISFMVKFP